MRKILGNKKGIQTILAALLMVVIVVVASVMVYAWSTGLLSSLLVKPSVGSEVLNLEQFSFNNATTVTLYVRNTGSVSVTLVAYYVKDSTGDQYSRTTWTGPTIGPGALSTTPIYIGANCPTCSQAGSPFTFTSGAYNVQVTTQKGTQFPWPVTK